MADNGWSVTTIGELCDKGILATQTGPFGSQLHSYDYVASGIPVIPTEAIGRRRLQTEGIPQIAPETAARLARHRVQPGDILFARRGVQATGHSALVREDQTDWICGTGAILLRIIGDNLDPAFLSFHLSSDVSFEWLRQHAVGAVMPNLNEQIIRGVPLRLPPLTQQRAIANILGVLDDKIELNRRMNETLEDLARAIFQSWFVDFDPVRAKRDGLLPPGLNPAIAALFPDSFENSELGKIPRRWSTAVLDDVTGFLIGGDWGKESAVEDATEAVLCVRGADIPSLQSGGVGKMPTRYLTASSLTKRRLIDGDIVFEISGGSPTQSTGRPVLVTQAFLGRLPLPLTCSNFCRLIRPAEGISSKYLYCLLRRLYHADEFLQYENGTTGIKNLAFTVFSSIHKFVLPPTDVMAAFEMTVAPMYAKMAQVGFESEKLVAIRDALLPKLLSGEIRVAEAERLMEDVG